MRTCRGIVVTKQQFLSYVLEAIGIGIQLEILSGKYFCSSGIVVLIDSTMMYAEKGVPSFKQQKYNKGPGGTPGEEMGQKWGTRRNGGEVMGGNSRNPRVRVP